MNAKFLFLTIATVALVTGAAAKPATKADPVAEGFADWQGLSSRNYIAGREITPSDLRHKVTVFAVVESDEKLRDQLILLGKLMNQMSITTPHSGIDENWSLPRNYAGLVSCRGSASEKAVNEALKPVKDAASDVSQALSVLKGHGCSIYREASLVGEPEMEGKCPYVCVMGPSGKEPLWQGTLTAATTKDARDAMAKGAKEITGWETPWRPFFGNVAEPKFHPQLAKALEKGKKSKKAPLDPVAKAILANVKSSDPEKAREAQILFDAINQTRSDLLVRVTLEAASSPHLAVLDLEELTKYWPQTKKLVAKAEAAINAHPETLTLAKSYAQLRVWSAPEFKCKNAGEAKKIVQELNKMKKNLEKLKESNVTVLQNVACLIDMKVDELISSIPASVESK